MVTLKNRGRDHLAVEDDRHLATFVLTSHLVEYLGSLAVEFQRDSVALLVEIGEGPRDGLACECRAALDEDFDGFFFILPHGHRLDDQRGIHDFLAGFDALHAGAASIVHDGKLQFRHALELGFCLLGLFVVQTSDLNKDAILALRRNDRLADSVLIHALADDLHGLVEKVRRDAIFRLRHQTDQERSASLQVQTETNLLLRRNDLLDAKRG